MTPAPDHDAPRPPAGGSEPAGIDHRDADPAAVTPAFAVEPDPDEPDTDQPDPDEPDTDQPDTDVPDESATGDEHAEAQANRPTGADDVGA